MARAACGGLMRAAEDVQKFGTFTYAADAPTGTTSLLGACETHIGRTDPRSTIMRRPMSTA
jgi:hypothetical protein